MNSSHHFAIVSRILFLNRLSSFFFDIVPDTIHGQMSTPMSDARVKLLSFFNIGTFQRLIVLSILLYVLGLIKRCWLRRIIKRAAVELLLNFLR